VDSATKIERESATRGWGFATRRRGRIGYYGDMLLGKEKGEGQLVGKVGSATRRIGRICY